MADDLRRPNEVSRATRTVLYVNHTSRISGGERSLLLLLSGLPASVAPVLACPSGKLADAAAELGVRVERIPGTDSSLRLHPWHTPRGFADIARAALSVRSLARRVGAELVHANSIRAGLAASIAAHLGSPSTVVHVRDCLPPGAMSRLTRTVVSRGAAAVIANSAYTADRFGVRGTHRIYNPVDLALLDPGRFDRAATRRALGLSELDFVLAVVAQITRWKGQIDALRALARLVPHWPTLHLLIVGQPTFVAGATRFDNRAYLRELHAFVADQGLQRHVRFLGDRADVPELLAACDVLLAPSWEEPFGRSIVEAMAMGVPVLATNVGGPTETVRDAIDGRLLPPRDPVRWAEAIEGLLTSPGVRAKMASNVRQRAVAMFDVPTHVQMVVDVYDTVVGRS